MSFEASQAMFGKHCRLLRTTALTAVSVALIAANPAWAEAPECDDAMIPQPEDCARANSDVIVRMPTGKNTEMIRTAPGGDFASSGFSISVDGDTVAGAPAPKDPRRPDDINAAAADVQVRYDGLDRRQLLNVSTSDLRAAYRAGETINFRASTNYPAAIARAEIRVIDRSARGRQPITVLPIRPNGTASWTMPQGGSGDYAYALRVYDRAGRFDETVWLDLDRTTRAFPTHETSGGQVIAAGEGEDRTRIRHIPVQGGLVTTSGKGLMPGARVNIMGEDIPVDASGRFVSTRILPAGDHVVTVKMTENGRTRTIRRDVEVPRSEWFGVGIADLTFGKRFRDDLVSADPDYDETYAEGRLAMYLKGTTQGGYTFTTSVDTGEGDLEDIFKRLDDKDPRQVLRRLDPEDVYPTYGDDSTAYDDTPTSGRIYARIERGASSLTWGDFKADLQGGEFLDSTRELYGAELRYVTPSVTDKGDARAQVKLYAAQPDTLPQRDILRGSGGSVYFLSRQDINGGSETLSVQLIDPDTGRVVRTTRLVEGVDYEIDYLQGIVILASPLNSSAAGTGLISTGTGKYDVNLVAQYEYTPTMGSLDGTSLGARAEGWLTDDLRLGATFTRDETGTADQTTAGIDLRYELGEKSHVELEYAQTKGPGFGRAVSTDGGLTITKDGVVDAPRAGAYRFDANLDLQDLGATRPGFLNLYYERKEAGFSTLNQDITEDQDLFGLNAEVEISDRLTFAADYEQFDRDGGDSKTEGEFRLSYDINKVWSVDGAIGHLDKRIIGDASETGRRTDLAVRLNYRPSDDLLLYTYGQATLDRSGGLSRNNRVGVGVDARISEKMKVEAELSGGDLGTGGRLRLNYSPTADNEVYLGYTLDPTRTGAGYDLVGNDDGKLTLGANFRMSEKVSTFAENNWDLFGDRRSITRSYGVKYTPDARWTFAASTEMGEVRDINNGNFDRDAYSFGVAYSDDDQVSFRTRLEYRTENGATIAQDRDTWAFSAGYEYRLNPEWRFLANVDALFSDSDQSSVRDGEYAEASIGYAYRPVDNDRLNLLLRYTFLHDFPGEDQVTANGSTDGPKQRSHVFSIDGNYDLSPKLTLGAKYGYRRSEITDRLTSDTWESTAHLGIIRADWHVVHKWDILAEARMMYTEESDIRETGALLGVYRHLGNNAKIGVGYEWGQVSDNPTDLDYVGNGVFLNVIAKF
ncbi:outer membrane beta-barrel protein [Aliiroseovarius sediminis]|uniref:outer membrane beta-barrel protein n=1 Tax=Aliiroseovarius sediminis TaxID=2925839 RepID=UPI001F5AAE12|nr:outer membrane beta-barrel protein [Aliiroseovarius sediminis]MCI2394595.1 hypothetical protein [Aliiroseovarius sediminis]